MKVTIYGRDSDGDARVDGTIEFKGGELVFEPDTELMRANLEIPAVDMDANPIFAEHDPIEWLRYIHRGLRGSYCWATKPEGGQEEIDLGTDDEAALNVAWEHLDGQQSLFDDPDSEEPLDGK